MTCSVVTIDWTGPAAMKFGLSAVTRAHSAEAEAARSSATPANQRLATPPQGGSPRPPRRGGGGAKLRHAGEPEAGDAVPGGLAAPLVGDRARVALHVALQQG